MPLPVLPRPKGRPRVPGKVMPPGLNYATVHKHREDGRVVKVRRGWCSGRGGGGGGAGAVDGEPRR